MDALTSFTTEWLMLVSRLADLKCNAKNNWVCCRKGGFDDVTEEWCWDSQINPAIPTD